MSYIELLLTECVVNTQCFCCRRTGVQVNVINCPFFANPVLSGRNLDFESLAGLANTLVVRIKGRHFLKSPERDTFKSHSDKSAYEDKPEFQAFNPFVPRIFRRDDTPGLSSKAAQELDRVGSCVCSLPPPIASSSSQSNSKWRLNFRF